MQNKYIQLCIIKHTATSTHTHT